jgi:hypothetical protein
MPVMHAPIRALLESSCHTSRKIQMREQMCGLLETA